MRRIALLTVLLAALSVPVAGARTTDTTLSLVAYSTPKAAFTTIIPAFQQTSAGQGVSFTQSYGPSADQAQAIVNGLPAAGVEVLTPNPITSGGARWNVLAAYGAQLKVGKTPKQAVAYLYKLFHHVPVQDKSARDALNTFLAGKGDALLTYENEALLAQRGGQEVYFNIPKATIRIDNPIAVLSNSKNKATAQAFVNYLFTRPAQHLFAQSGYRPVLTSANKGFTFPVRPWQFTVDYLGGWTKANKKFFDPNTGLMAKIEASLGG